MTKIPHYLLSLTCSLLMVGGADAATSYFLIHADFDRSGVSEEYRWSVHYDEGSLVTANDLLNVIFGPKFELDDDGFMYQQMGDFTLEYSYGGTFISAISLGDDTLLEDWVSEGWSSYAANGDYVSSWDGSSGTYAASWETAVTGINDRYLVDGSFDALVFSSYDPSTYVYDFTLSGTPTVEDFAQATVVNVPEPSRMLLLSAAFAGYVMRRRR